MYLKMGCCNINKQWNSLKRKLSHSSKTDLYVVIPRTNMCNVLESNMGRLLLLFPDNPRDGDTIYIKDISKPTYPNLNTIGYDFLIKSTQNIEIFPQGLKQGPYEGTVGDVKAGIYEWKYLESKGTWFITSWL